MEELATSAFGQWNANTVVATAAQTSAYVSSGLSSLSSEVDSQLSVIRDDITKKVILKRWDD